jgi:hypothetical protein
MGMADGVVLPPRGKRMIGSMKHIGMMIRLGISSFTVRGYVA